MKNISTLVYYDLKRFWILRRIIILSVFFVLAVLLSLLPLTINLPNLKIELNFNTILQSVLSFFIPVFVLMFTGGIISNDIRSYYLRTLLSRPISKEEYLCSKYLFSIINLIITTILFAIIPTLIGLYSYQANVNLNIATSLITYIFYLIEGLLFISISISLSTIVKGYFNIFILAIWIFLESTLINGILSNLVSFSKPLAIFSDFFFPAGFSEAVKLLDTHSILFYESIMWGLASLTFFVSISFYQINKINIDANSD